MLFEDKVRWISVSISDLQLIELKRQFKTVINSKRKYSQINNFVDLIGILISRGAVRIDDHDFLNQISRQYLGRDFSEVFESQSTVSLSNVPQKQLGQIPFLQTCQETSKTEGPGCQTAVCSEAAAEGRTSVVSQEVVEYIAGKLAANQWRRFLRYLNVEEHSVADERSIADKVLKGFSIFLQNTDLGRQWHRLEVALESIKRMDLRDYCEAAMKRG